MLRAFVTALLVTAVTLAVPAAPAAADDATCSSSGSGPVTGGYDVTIYCSGAGYIHGYGTTLTDANLEALYLYQIYSSTGVNCSGQSTGRVTGGYDATVFCTGAGFIHGYGTTLTDAAGEARVLAGLYASTRRDCSGQGTGRVTGGYDVTLYCPDLGFVHGVGTTLTGAARTARLAAEIG